MCSEAPVRAAGPVPARRPSGRRHGRRISTALVLAVSAVLTPCTVAGAEPGASSSSGVITETQVSSARAGASAAAAKVTDLQAKLTTATTSLTSARAAFGRASTVRAQAVSDRKAADDRAAGQRAEAERVGRQADESRTVLGRWAAQSYMSGSSVPPEMLALLNAQSTDDFANSLATQRILGRQLDSVVSEVSAAQQRQNQLVREADTAASSALAAVETADNVQAAAKSVVSQRQNEVTAAMAALTEAKTAASAATAAADTLAAALAAQQAEQQREAAVATQAGSGSGATGSAAKIVVTGSPTAQQVMDIAAGLTGIYYKWGGTTPAGFDCSGFTGYVFRQVGVSLPRTARQQQAAATPVTDPQPGDLVFFGTPATHVGIYAGNGMMYDSPHTGAVTSLRTVHSGVSGYGRVLPAG